MLRTVTLVLVASTLAATLAACANTNAGSNSTAGAGSAEPTIRSISPVTPAPSTAAPLPGTTRSAAPVIPPSPPATGTGIAGVTVMDGGCPVLRADPPCPDRPIAAHLSILDTGGTVVTTVDSGADGHFTVALKPGSYVVRPETLAGAPPHAPQGVAVTVKTDQYTVLTLRFDSGIR